MSCVGKCQEYALRHFNRVKCSPDSLFLLVQFVIQVFVHSYSPAVDYELYREASQHTYCAPDLARWANDSAFSRFKGRFLPTEHFTALAKALEIAEKTNQKLETLDVSHATDRIKALKRRIRKTPAIVMNGKKYEGIKEIEAVASKLCGNLTQSNYEQHA